MHVMIVMGTRPEIIKLAPIVWAIRDNHPEHELTVVLSGQHEAHARDHCAALDVEWDADLGIRVDRPAVLLGRCTEALDEIIQERKPDVMCVQGDTTTTLAGALAGFYAQLPVAHVEAGLRTGDLSAPFPEEGNRKIIGAFASMHLAPTQSAIDKLLAEDVDPETIVLAGNTVVDAVRKVAAEAEPADHPGELHAVVTIHRRENWGEPFELMCNSVRKLVESRPELGVSFVMHPNPALQERAKAVLGETERVQLLQPMGYLAFVSLLASADVILTDSGGIQEEAVSLAKPLVVLRRSTERTEGVDAGVAVLAGAGGIGLDESVDEALALDLSADRDLYGDGKAGERIARALVSGRIGEAEWSK